MKKRGRNVVVPWLMAHRDHADDACLIWPFTYSGNGYGWVKFNGKSCNASRAMCALAHGAPPFEGAVTAHSCDNKRCVNPRHLRWATQSDNLYEMAERRLRSYEAKLTDEQVAEIRALRGVKTGVALARHYGVHRNQIYRIQGGKQRAHPRRAKG